MWTPFAPWDHDWHSHGAKGAKLCVRAHAMQQRRRCNGRACVRTYARARLRDASTRAQLVRAQTGRHGRSGVQTSYMRKVARISWTKKRVERIRDLRLYASERLSSSISVASGAHLSRLRYAPAGGSSPPPVPPSHTQASTRAPAHTRAQAHACTPACIAAARVREGACVRGRVRVAGLVCECVRVSVCVRACARVRLCVRARACVCVRGSGRERRPTAGLASASLLLGARARAFRRTQNRKLLDHRRVDAWRGEAGGGGVGAWVRGRGRKRGCVGEDGSVGTWERMEAW
eukprot:4852361-Pleurochrysis_carterae.AAC.3